MDFDGTAVVHAEAPLRDVKMMRAPIGHVAAGIIAEIAPAEWVNLVAVTAEGSRTEPHVPIHALRNGLSWQVAFGRRATDFDEDFFHFSDETTADEFARDAKSGRGALHGARLQHTPVLADGVDHLAAFANGQGKRFFAVDIFARFRGGASDQRVPVIGRGNNDGVNVVAREDFAEVVVDIAALVFAALFVIRVFRFNAVFRFRPRRFEDIADGDELCFGISEKIRRAVRCPDRRLRWTRC